jgi:hypothetical protein
MEVLGEVDCRQTRYWICIENNGYYTSAHSEIRNPTTPRFTSFNIVTKKEIGVSLVHQSDGWFQSIANEVDLDMVVSSEQLALLTKGLGLSLLDLGKSRPV